LARWLEELGQYDMKIVQRPGRRHVNADALSREANPVCEKRGTLPFHVVGVTIVNELMPVGQSSTPKSTI
jgi:hypothetical protein